MPAGIFCLEDAFRFEFVHLNTKLRLRRDGSILFQ